MFSKIPIEKTGTKDSQNPHFCISHDLNQHLPAFPYGWLCSPALHMQCYSSARRTSVELTLEMWIKLHKLKVATVTETRLSITREMCKISENWLSLQLFSGNHKRIRSWNDEVNKKRKSWGPNRGDRGTHWPTAGLLTWRAASVQWARSCSWRNVTNRPERFPAFCDHLEKSLRFC